MPSTAGASHQTFLNELIVQSYPELGATATTGAVREALHSHRYEMGEPLQTTKNTV